MTITKLINRLLKIKKRKKGRCIAKMYIHTPCGERYAISKVIPLDGDIAIYTRELNDKEMNNDECLKVLLDEIGYD